MAEVISFDCQPNNTQKAIQSVYSELLCSDDKLNRRPAYQRNLVWDPEQKGYLVDTIMTNCPMPIFLLYMNDTDEEYECIDGQNRLTTIKEYIEQDSVEKVPFSWRVETEIGEEHIYYLNDKTKEAMQKFCDEQNKKRKSKLSPKTYRLMNAAEVKRYNKYELTLSQIKTKLTFNQRKQIFRRWQNGTGISQCDGFKNEPYIYCEYVVQNALDRDLTTTISALLKSSRNNWLWDIYRLLNVFQKDDIPSIILSTIYTRSLIEKDATTSAQWKDCQTKLEKLIAKLKPLETLKSSMYLTFLIGYIHLWRTANPAVRSIAEKEECLLAFAKKSLAADDHNHSTLNNGPQVKAFIGSFATFKNCFYAIIDAYTPPSPIPVPKKKETIPASVKTEVWNTFIGKEKGGGECCCCGKKSITQREFHAGHVIPDRDGGLPEVNNLRPICAPCNLSMGPQNMINFMAKYYPHNKFKELPAPP